LGTPGTVLAESAGVVVVAGQAHALDPAGWLEDTAGRARLEEIQRRDADFRPLQELAGKPAHPRSVFWLRYAIESTSAAPQRLFLHLDQQHIADAALFVTVAGRLISSEWTGERIPARVRPVSGSILALPFDLPARSSAVLYLRITADGLPSAAKTRIVDEATLANLRGHELWRNGILVGVFGTLLVVNLVLWGLRRRHRYGLFLLLLIDAYAGLSAYNGFGPAYLYPALTWPQRQGVPMALGAAALLLPLFTRAFLGTAQTPFVDRVLRWMSIPGLVMVVVASILSSSWGLSIGMLLLFGMALLIATVAWRMWRHGMPAARVLVVAHLLVALTMLHQGLMNRGLLAWELASADAAAIGIVAVMLLLSIALADRHGFEQRDAARHEAAIRAAFEQHRGELERVAAQRAAELEQARNHAEYLATTDPLTGFHNRRSLLPLLAREVEIARRSKEPLSLIAFDIDHFKRLNGEFGTGETDRILQEVAAAVRGTLRGPDLLGRFSGEEFVLVLRDTSAETARDIAERLRVRIAGSVHIGPDARIVTASFGVATMGSSLDTVDDLLRMATRGIDRAKSRGRNRVEPMEPEGDPGAGQPLPQRGD
jgi:diguanylate cyclase (GGDEF)-like protein